jgi:hypothetical protein
MQEKNLEEDMEKAGYKVIISGIYYKGKTFPSLNDYLAECGKNPKAGGKLKSDYMMIANNAIRRGLKRWKPRGKITLAYRFYEPKKGQIRDNMNVFSFFDKVFQDALVKCGVIQDDSPDYVDGNFITHKFYYTSKTPWVEVDIIEIGN